MKHSRLVRSLVLIGFSLVALTGCSNTTDPQSEAQAPNLPPASSLLVDLSFFNNNKPEGVNAEAAVHDAQGTQLNFLNAVVRANFINVAVLTAVTPPYLAFAAAIHSVPHRDDDGAYRWVYTWRDSGQDHRVILRGTPVGDFVEWELNVEFAGAESELWFHGRSHRDRDEGYWVFRDFTRTGDPEVLRIEWLVNSETDASLTLINQDESDEEFGDELRYRVDGVAASMEFEDADEATTWDILWDESDGSGSLRVPDYNNGNRACWDAQQQDAACLEAGAAE